MRQVWCIVCLLLMLGSPLHTENFRFRVYLKDKGDNLYSLEHPEEFLSAHSIERRKKQNIIIDISDIPISRAYLDALEDCHVRIVAQSKWMRTVVVESSDSLAIQQVSVLPMVDSIKFVWRGDTSKFNFKRQENILRYQVKENVKKNIYGFGKEQIALLKGERLHKRGFRGEGMRIAVIDAGFHHVDCINAFDSLYIGGTFNVSAPGQSVFGYDDHGTKVLSCLAAWLPGIMIGTAPKATYWLIKSEDSSSEYPIEEDYWLAAAEYADSVGVDIITSSLGYFSFDEKKMNYSTTQLDGHTALISQGATMAARKGILVFCSAGNEGASDWGTITVPADAEEILTVGAVDKKKQRCPFSSTGYTVDGRIKPDVVALGTRCAVIEPSGKLSFANGTSFATPILAGICACAWQALPWHTSKRMMQLILEYASNYKNPNLQIGYGIPDLFLMYKKERRHAPN